MPFTPYHFGPSGFLGLAFRKWLDIPVFVLANVVVDLEPLAVLVFRLNYPLHGLCHTFLIGTAVGLAWALIAYQARGILARLMQLFALPYKTSLAKMIVSAVLGVWFHIFLDSICWYDVKPFWPLQANPFLDLVTVRTVYIVCTLSFLPAIILYVAIAVFQLRRRSEKTV
jgi:membrane-bound metal-dependent hydrolase YbcI (DUF457 family)